MSVATAHKIILEHTEYRKSDYIKVTASGPHQYSIKKEFANLPSATFANHVWEWLALHHISTIKQVILIAKRNDCTIEIEDPRLAKLYHQAMELHKQEDEAIWIRDNEMEEMFCYDWPIKPWKHQAVSFNFARLLDNVALLLDVGVGKTKVALDLIIYRMREKQIRRCLVVCPPAVQYTWQNEIPAMCGGYFRNGDVLYLPSSSTHAKALLKAQGHTARVVVANWDALGKLWKSLTAWGYDMVVYDETSKIKSWRTSRFKNTLQISAHSDCKYRVIMTGTPITQSPLDVFSQFFVLDMGTSFGVQPHSFAERVKENMKYIVPNKNGDIEIDWIREIVYRKAIRYEVEECLTMPPKVYERIEIPMGKEQRRVYKDMQDKLQAEMDGMTCISPIMLTKSLKLLQICGGYFRAETGGEEKRTVKLKENPKLDAFEELAESLKGKPFLVWAHFRWEQKDLYDTLLAQGHRVRRLPNTKNAALACIDDFRNGKFDVIVAHTLSGGIGLNLQRAKHMVYYSCNWSLDQRYQSEGRSWRAGQDHKVIIYDLMMANSVDQFIRDALRAKHGFASGLINKSSKALFESYNPNFDSIEDVIAPDICPDCAYIYGGDEKKCPTCGRNRPKNAVVSDGPQIQRPNGTENGTDETYTDDGEYKYD